MLVRSACIVAVAIVVTGAVAHAAAGSCPPGCFTVRGRGPLLGADRVTIVELLGSESAGLRRRDGTRSCATVATGRHSQPIEDLWDAMCTDGEPGVQLRAKLTRHCTRLHARVKAGTTRWQRLRARRETAALDRCGWTLVPLAPADRVTALSIRPDGSIVVGATVGNEGRQGFGVFRFTGQGAPDETFGDGGRVVTFPPAGSWTATAMTTQPDGAVLIAGIEPPFGQPPVIVRYANNGTLDSRYGVGGIAAIAGLQGEPVALVALENGAVQAADDRHTMIRLKADGAPDPPSASAA